jgi:hypothetical protein
MLSFENFSGKANTEVVFYNGGAVYKAPSNSELAGNYTRSSTADSIFPFNKVDGKKYYWSKEFREAYFSGSVYDDGASSADFTDIDICPNIRHLDALGICDYQDKGNCDIFFGIESLEELGPIGEYYNLPHPLNKEQEAYLDNILGYFAFKTLPGREFIPASIKFIDGKPSVFKLYLYPKFYKKWKIWMSGESVHRGGSKVEYGVSIRQGTGGVKIPGFNSKNSGGTTLAEMIYSKYKDLDLVYKLEDTYDTSLHWTGLVLNAHLDVVDRRNFRSTELGRFFKYNTGMAATELEESLPKTPKGVLGWFGYSWFDSKPEELECYFPFTGRYEDLVAIGTQYGLEVPCKKEDISTLLDIRASHYVLPGASEQVPIAVCSIVFNKAGDAVDFLLYKFKRSWEFDEILEVPDVVPLIEKIESSGKDILQHG